MVLSNNDGCAISRSEEAKAIGIEMGTNAFEIEEVLRAHNVAVFSSNYTLYGDMSERVMKTMQGMVPRLEIYSIDEAFLDMHDMPHTDLLKLGIKIRNTVKQDTGIPVTVGIAPTKTLAKMANRYAKKKRKDVGVFWAANERLVDEMLSFTKIGDVWGIGKQYATFLIRHGIKTARDLLNAPEDWVRKHMTVVGHRLIKELKGIPSIEWEFEPAAKKNICTSRSFGVMQTDKEVLREAVSNYAATCAAKLRQQNSCCKKVHVFIKTNQHRVNDKQYQGAITIELSTPSNNSGEIIKYALKALDILYLGDCRYKKVGVVVLDIIPEAAVQANLFSSPAPKGKLLMQTMDKVNKALGRDIVRVAVQGFEKRHRLKAEHLSPSYTTDINQVIKVTI